MFGKHKSQSNVRATDTFIGEGTIVEGRLITNASLRIEGSVVGDIECAGDITIGEKGIAHSIISARNVFNAGAIKGSVRARGKLSITSKGRVEGSIRVGSLHVSEGGLFNGECVMEKSAANEARAGGEKNHAKRDKSENAGDRQDKDGKKASAAS